MPVLKNAKHERFAQEVAKGKTADEAYVLAGYAESRKNASRLRANDDIKARIEDILSRAAVKAEVSIADVLAELRRIGFADPRDVMTWGKTGLVLKESAELTAAEAAIVSEVAQTKDGMRIKLHSKIDALGKIGQHFGMFKDRVEHTGKDGGPIETMDLTPTQRARRIAFALAQGERTK